MTRLRVRRAQADDGGLVARMGARMFRDAFGPDNRREDMEMYIRANFSDTKIRSELAEPDSRFLILEADGHPKGYARLAVSRPPDCVQGLDPLELVRLYVDLAVAGSGHGSVLMDACCGEALGLGRGSIWLGVWEENARAIRFYRKQGFEHVGSRPFVLGTDVQQDWIMERILTPRGNYRSFSTRS